MNKEPSHICVLHRYPISQALGTNPSFRLFLEKLLANSHEVTFISFKEPDKDFEIEGVRHVELDREISRANFFNKLTDSMVFLFKVPFVIRALSKKKRIGLVYCDDSFPFYGFLIKKITHLPVIIRMGDLQSAYMFAQGGVVKRLMFKLIFFMEKKMWMQVDKVVPISNAFRRFLIDNGIPQQRLEVVTESIDLEGFARDIGLLSVREKYSLGDNTVVMFHGLISPIKGIDTLLRAAKRTIETFHNIKFIIIGSGTDLKKLKRMSQDLGIGEDVIFTGWIPLSQIPAYINACDIGIPSRNSNLGNNFVVTTALVQYWSLKKPVVLPGLQAMSEVVRGTRLEDFLFEPDNHDDLFKKIKTLINKSLSERDSVGEEGYKLASEYFNIESVSDNMVKVLERHLVDDSLASC